MNEKFITELKPVVVAATNRTQSLIDALIGNFEIDWATGKSRIGSSTQIVTAFQRILEDDNVDDLAVSFLATLSDGFAVGRDPMSPEDSRFCPIPWRSLFHEPSLASMTVKDWDWLGIRRDSSASEIAASVRRFPNHPDYVLEQAHLDSLAGSAGFYIGLLNEHTELPPRPSGFALRRVWKDTVPGGDIGVLRQGLGGDEPPKGAPAPPPGPDYAQIANAFLSFIKEIGECLATAQWSIQWALFYPLGVRICLGAACAQKVANALKALLGTSSGSIVATIGALFAKGLLTWGQLLSSLGWVGLAMLHFASYWTAMILANVTPRGVCIIHLFPWNSALSGGVFNGWAEGR
jgi:hypothetical protein